MSDGARPTRRRPPTLCVGGLRARRGWPAVTEAEFGLDGVGRLIDVGCGPGVLAVQLAPLFTTVIGIDPEPEMSCRPVATPPSMRCGRPRTQARGEDLATLDVPAAWLVTFGRWIHRAVASACSPSVHEVLEAAARWPSSPDRNRDRRPSTHPSADPARPDRGHAGELPRLVAQPESTPTRRRSRVAVRCVQVAYAPGRADIVRTTDAVVSATCRVLHRPDRFGDPLAGSWSELKVLLADAHPPDCSMTGQATPPSSGRSRPPE